ncbi:MAG: glycosyltransferase family 2 protein [Methylococcaceae bacterium]|nr:glycosyltransferase family 2 protein [Methylococcaceae bacterium]
MISVTIPIYNEEGNLPHLYTRITEVLRGLNHPWELILVNDGSSDRSAQVLDGLAAKDASVKVVHFRRNFGQTAAIMAGFDYAQGEIIISIDGDLQNDPRDIPKLLEKIEEGYDVCSGWRKDRHDHALRRNLPSRIANRLISLVSGVHLHDFGCSLKAYRSDVIKGVQLYGEMHRFIPIYASWHGAKVAEVPVTHYPRLHGKSKYGLDRVVKVILDLVVVKFLKHHSLKPMYIFGGFGLINLFVSVVVASLAFYLKYYESTSLIQTPLPLLSVMTFVMGIMCILMGLLAELLTRTYYESQDKHIYLVRKAVNFGAERTTGKAAS